MASAASWLPQRRGEIVLRPLRESDLEELWEIESDGWLKQFIVGGPVTDPKETWVPRARSLCNSDNFFALEHAPTGTFAGRASLGHFLREANSAHREVQIVLGRAFLSKGLGREACALLCTVAFSFLGASSVFAVVHPAHEPSLRLVDALGFVEVAPMPGARVFELVRSGA